MPNLHLFSQELGVEFLIYLEPLKGKEVHVREHPLSLNLLLVKLAQVGHGRECSEPAKIVLVRVKLRSFINHLESFFEED